MDATSIRVGEGLSWAENLLREKGISTARLDAGVLLAHVLGVQRTFLATHSTRLLTPGQHDEYRQAIERRAKAEPVAYLTGVKEFWSLSIRVDSRVLIPRPETETLLEAALEVFQKEPPKLFVDVGTGSGCVACALASIFPESRGLAIDCDLRVLELARENIRVNGAKDRVQVVESDGLQAVTDKSADLICANLPYIPSSELTQLPDDVRLHEPMTALDGGADGLTIIRALIRRAPDKLTSKGYLVFEVGVGQAPVVMELCRRIGFTHVHARMDLSEVKRVVVAGRARAF